MNSMRDRVREWIPSTYAPDLRPAIIAELVRLETENQELKDELAKYRVPKIRTVTIVDPEPEEDEAA
jgi:hypothetical protein